MDRFGVTRIIILETGKVLASMQSCRLDLAQIMKSRTDFTTEADTRAEKNIVEQIMKSFPEDDILAEESAPDTFDEYASKERLWIIDPLDGTTNYSLGEENYAISIAFVRKGVPVFGHVYQPARELLVSGTEPGLYVNDSGKHIDAFRGSIVGHSRNLRVSPETDPNKCTIGHNWYYTIEGKQRMASMLDRIIPGNFRAFMARGSAVGDLLAVADGRAHAYVQENLKPWDVAAAGLLVQLAGGTVTGIDGTPWHPFRHDILASNGHLHEQLLRLLNSPT
jgi:myo-inositol-1(or 4)-monophosphatase